MGGLLTRLDVLDKQYSGVLHKYEGGYLDLLVFIPAVVFGVWGVPFFPFIYYYLNDSILYLLPLLAVVLSNEGLKYVFKRPRPHPKGIGKKFPDLRSVHNNPSFPSGDTAQAAVAAVTLIWHGFDPLLSALLIPVGAFGRIYYGSHYIGDCLFGALLGVVLTQVIYTFLFDRTDLHSTAWLSEMIFKS